MIFDFSKDLEKLRATSDDLEAAMLLFSVYCRGVNDEQQRCVRIIQQYAIEPMRIVRIIRKPRR